MPDRIAVDTQLDSYVSAKQLAKTLGLSKSGFYNLCKSGLFPKGIRLGSSRRWQLSEVKNWLDTKKEI